MFVLHSIMQYTYQNILFYLICLLSTYYIFPLEDGSVENILKVQNLSTFPTFRTFFIVLVSSTKQFIPYICSYIVHQHNNMSNEKTNLFNISFCNVPDITFFCLFTGTTEEGRRCPQWRRCQRSGTYQSIESHRGSRHSDRLYSRHHIQTLRRLQFV